MARIRSTEFVKFCETGKTQRFGNLVMKGDDVYSYHTKIATVDRNAKIIRMNEQTYSKTTSCHQSAIVRGHGYLDHDWSLIRSCGL
jgi:hypothetical protein